MITYQYVTDLKLDDSCSVVAELEHSEYGYIGAIFKRNTNQYYFEIYPTNAKIVLNVSELSEIIEKIKKELSDYKFSS